MGVCGGDRLILTVVAGLLGGAAAPAASAPAASAPTDLSVPIFSSQGGLDNLNVAAAQNGPPGTVAVTQSAAPAGYSFEEFKQNVHGYVETGVTSRGGYGVNGGLLIPLVPGKAELEVSGGTGQTGNVFPKVQGLKHTSITTTAYNVGLHVHPTDDLDIYVGYTGINAKLPSLPYR